MSSVQSGEGGKRPSTLGNPPLGESEAAVFLLKGGKSNVDLRKRGKRHYKYYSEIFPPKGGGEFAVHATKKKGEKRSGSVERVVNGSRTGGEKIAALLKGRKYRFRKKGGESTVVKRGGNRIEPSAWQSSSMRLIPN